jgi:hypothetical protein
MRKAASGSAATCDLLVRNQKLASEIAKLQNENRLLKKRLSSLLIIKLQLASTKQDAQTQTDQIDVRIGEQKCFLGELDRMYLDEQLLNMTEQSVEGNGIIHSTTGIEEFETYHHCSGHRDLEYMNPKLSRRSKLFIPTPHSTLDSPTKGVTISPSQLSVSSKLIDKMTTPCGTSNKENDCCKAIFQLDFSGGGSRRTPRSTRKPLSYLEPSLHVKVRKGFQFFRFSDT